MTTTLQCTAAAATAAEQLCRPVHSYLQPLIVSCTALHYTSVPQRLRGSCANSRSCSCGCNSSSSNCCEKCECALVLLAATAPAAVTYSSAALCLLFFVCRKRNAPTLKTPFLCTANGCSTVVQRLCNVEMTVVRATAHCCCCCSAAAYSCDCLARHSA
eukprot:2779-Heterococcus_DN1.PRE.2